MAKSTTPASRCACCGQRLPTAKSATSQHKPIDQMSDTELYAYRRQTAARDDIAFVLATMPDLGAMPAKPTRADATRFFDLARRRLANRPALNESAFWAQHRATVAALRQTYGKDFDRLKAFACSTWPPTQEQIKDFDRQLAYDREKGSR